MSKDALISCIRIEKGDKLQDVVILQTILKLYLAIKNIIRMNKMTKTLTEQWKDGTLHSGEYYIKLDDGSFTTDKYFGKSGGFAEEIPVEVIYSVPTYEEYLGLLSDQLAKNEAEEINAELEAENKRLKEQIEEANVLMGIMCPHMDNETLQKCIEYGKKWSVK